MSTLTDMEATLGRMSRWVRVGDRVHRRSCRYAQAGVPWVFAAHLDEVGLADALARVPWLLPCRVCEPTAEPPDQRTGAVVTAPRYMTGEQP